MTELFKKLNCKKPESLVVLNSLEEFQLVLNVIKPFINTYFKTMAILERAVIVGIKQYVAEKIKN